MSYVSVSSPARLFRVGALWSPVEQKQQNFLDRSSITRTRASTGKHLYTNGKHSVFNSSNLIKLTSMISSLSHY